MAESARAAEIIHSLRRYVTKCSPQRVPLDINVVVRNVQQMLAGEARQRACAVSLQCDERLPRVNADRVQIEQVLINLICNGFDALETISDPKSIKIETRLGAAGTVDVAITDNGCGLPREHAQKIFDAFFSTKPQGLGMGLAICRSIIEAHDGRLWATARPEGGTAFCFSLPAHASNLS